jgi:hypothetical protein
MNAIRILHFATVTSMVGACWVAGLCLFQTPRDYVTSANSYTGPDDRFTQATGSTIRQGPDEDDSALVRAAKEFALYLNPPAPVKQVRENPVSEKAIKGVAKAEPQITPENTSAKFELRGISYHRLRPEESMALVWEPGAGSRWVRQGTQIGHIVVDKINGDSIVCKNGERVLAMSLGGQKTATAVAKVHKKEPAPAPKDSHSITTAPRPLLVRGMRQIPLARLTVNQQQDTPRELTLTAQ